MTPSPLLLRKLLRHVWCGPHRWAIYTVAGLIDETQCAGRCKPREREIEVDSALEGVERAEVLLHEMVHAVDSTFDLGIDEPTTRILGLGLAQMIDDAGDISD